MSWEETVAFETTIPLYRIPNTAKYNTESTTSNVIAIGTCKRYCFSCHPESSVHLLGKASDMPRADFVPFSSYSSHLILEQYQDSDLPLTSTEGTDTKGRRLHFLTQLQAAVARQTIPLARLAAVSWIHHSSALLETSFPQSIHALMCQQI